MSRWRTWLRTGAAEETAAPPPWSRTERLAVGVLVALLLASLAVLVHPWFQQQPDAAMFVVSARALLDGEGYSLLGTPMLVRPPGMSVLILPILWAAGTHFLLLNLYVNLLGLAAVVALYSLLRVRLHQAQAMLVCVAIWLNPAFREWCNVVLSDVPSLAAVLGCLLVERTSARRDSVRWELGLGVLIGLAVYVRTLNALLVPAIVLSRVARRWQTPASERSPWLPFLARRVLPLAATAFAVALPWSVRNERMAFPPPADQMPDYSASTRMWHEDGTDPSSPRLPLSAIVGRVPEQARAIGEAVGRRMQRADLVAESAGVTWVAATVLLGSFLVVLVRRRAPAELYVAGLLAALAIYWGFKDRYVLPVYALALPATVEVLRDVTRAVAGRWAARVVPCLALVALVALDWNPRPDWESVERKHTDEVELARALVPRLRADARLVAWSGWAPMIYLERPVYTCRVVMRRNYKSTEERRTYKPLDGFEALLDKYSLNTMLVERDSVLLPYLETTYPDREWLGDVCLVRVRP